MSPALRLNQIISLSNYFDQITTPKKNKLNSDFHSGFSRAFPVIGNVDIDW